MLIHLGGQIMNRHIATLALAFILTTTGCNKGSTRNGPGTMQKEEPTQDRLNTNGFKLVTPSTTIAQGEKARLTIGIQRGENFSEDIALTFESLPQGVTIEPLQTVFKITASEETVSIEAAKDAAVGNFTINVISKPASQRQETIEPIKLTVKRP
jgi:hypothetical protein